MAVAPTGPAPGERLSSELEALSNNPLARLVARIARRLRQVDQAHPALMDSLLGLALLVVGLADLFVGNDRRPSGAATLDHHIPTALIAASAAVQTLPLVWRRRAPSAVLTAVLVSSAFQWWLDVSLRSAFALLIVLYSVARYDPIRRLSWAAPACAAALTVAAFRAMPFKEEPWNSLFFLCGTATAAITLALFIRVRQAQIGILSERAARLEVEREQRVRLATLAERSRVSREMHDIVGHNLAVIVGLADGASHGDAPDPVRNQEVLRLIAGTGRQALSEVRGTLRALRETESADLNPQPGLTDLSVLLETVRAAGPRIVYRTAGDLDAVTPTVALAAYRIVQEALTNSLKHAGPATTIDVTVRVTGGEVEVRVHDSGGPDGTVAAGSADQEGQGLVGIAERAALTGGTAMSGPGDTGGWTVHAVLPLAPRPVQNTSEKDHP